MRFIILFLIFTSNGLCSQNIKKHQLKTEDLVSEENKFSWNLNKADSITIDLGDKPTSFFFDYSRDTFVLNLLSNKHIEADFKINFFSKDKKKAFSFDFSKMGKGFTQISRSFRYDMQRFLKTDNISFATIKISSMNKKHDSLLIVSSVKQTKRTSKRIRTIENKGVKGFFSDTLYNHYNKIKIPNYDNNSIDKIEPLKRKFLSFLKNYKSGTACSEPYNSITIKEARINLEKIISTQKQLHSVNPETTGRSLLTMAKWMIGKNVENIKSELNLFEKVIEEVIFFGFRENSSITYNQYFVREFYQSLLLGYDKVNLNLKIKIKKIFIWYLQINKIFEIEPIISEITSDLIRNEYLYVLGYIILIEQKNRLYLENYSNHLSKIITSDNRKSWIKSDGTSFHHKSQNIPYTYSYNELSWILKFINLAGGKLTLEATNKIIKGVAAVYTSIKKNNYPNNLSGRHPFNTTNEICDLTLHNLLELPLSLKNRNLLKLFLKGDESDKVGFKVFNFGNSSIFRTKEFLVSVKGFSKNHWGSEIYKNENRFGLYQGFGTLELINNKGFKKSGFSEKGWDWNMPPGSTTIVLPWSLLEPNEQRKDTYSITDFAGGLELGKNESNYFSNKGLFAFNYSGKIETDNDSIGFKFKKSYFFLDNYIICLGSDIQSTNSDYKVITTVLQKNHSNSKEISINSNRLRPLYGNSLKTIKQSPVLIEDEFESYHIYGPNNVTVEVKEQNSPNNENTNFKTGTFRKVYIEHSKSKKVNDYEYTVFLDKETLKWANFKKPYEVIQKDSQAHIIKEIKTSRLYYAIFGPYLSSFKNDIINTSSTQLLVSIKQNKNIIDISVCNPSMSYDDEGNLNVTSTKIELKGIYKILESNKYISSVSKDKNSTFILIFKDGNQIDFKLLKE